MYTSANIKYSYVYYNLYKTLYVRVTTNYLARTRWRLFFWRAFGWSIVVIILPVLTEMCETKKKRDTRTHHEYHAEKIEISALEKTITRRHIPTPAELHPTGMEVAPVHHNGERWVGEDVSVTKLPLVKIPYTHYYLRRRSVCKTAIDRPCTFSSYNNSRRFLEFSTFSLGRSMIRVPAER